MNTVYEVNKDLTSDDFIALGYEILPFDITGNDLVVAKCITFPREHNLSRQAIDDVLNNPKWQKAVLEEQDMKDYLEDLGIIFEEVEDEFQRKKYKVVENDELFELVCNWRLEINFSDEDKWVGLATSDIITHNVYFATSLLDNLCEKEIEELLEMDYISVKGV